MRLKDTGNLPARLSRRLHGGGWMLEVGCWRPRVCLIEARVESRGSAGRRGFAAVLIRGFLCIRGCSRAAILQGEAIRNVQRLDDLLSCFGAGLRLRVCLMEARVESRGYAGRRGFAPVLIRGFLCIRGCSRAAIPQGEAVRNVQRLDDLLSCLGAGLRLRVCLMGARVESRGSAGTRGFAPVLIRAFLCIRGCSRAAVLQGEAIREVRRLERHRHQVKHGRERAVDRRATAGASPLPDVSGLTYHEPHQP